MYSSNWYVMLRNVKFDRKSFVLFIRSNFLRFSIFLFDFCEDIRQFQEKGVEPRISRRKAINS